MSQTSAVPWVEDPVYNPLRNNAIPAPRDLWQLIMNAQG